MSRMLSKEPDHLLIATCAVGTVGHLPVQELGRNDRLVVLEEPDIWLFSEGVPGTFFGGTTVFTVERS